MSDATLVALTILGGVFVVMSLAILKAGIEAAIKMWSVMGALTGVAFGAITSFYFTSEVKDREVAALKSNFETVLASAGRDAAEAREVVFRFSRVLEGDPQFASEVPSASRLSDADRSELLQGFSTTTRALDRIEALDLPLAVQESADPLRDGSG